MFKVIVVLLLVIACQAVLLVWLWRGGATPDFSFGGFRGRSGGPSGGPSGGVEDAGGKLGFTAEVNLVQRGFPYVDFAPLYPGMSATDIDRVQRESFAIRYVYAPVVEIEPVPVAGRFVNVTSAGYRRGLGDQPWPPDPNDLVVFVFGGSTTFGYGVADDKTVVSQLQLALTAHYPGRRVQCYNFGRGYFTSTQEGLLFAQLLQRGLKPHLAVFIDGVNDFQYVDGRSPLTDRLFRFTAPDLPPPARPRRTPAQAAAQVVFRLQQNQRMIEAVAQAYDVAPIFVGQPVPFLHYPRTPGTFPFRDIYPGHELCAQEYGRYEEASARGDFGKRFIWCGDVFAQASVCMYADSLHYSNIGCATLARTLVERAAARGLLPQVK